MTNFCANCGAPLNDGARFCPKCGTMLNTAPAPRPAAPVCAGCGAVRTGLPAPGYSDRANHPEILAAMKKNRRASVVFAFILVPLPLIVALAYGAAHSDEMGQALLIGGIVSVVFLLFALFGFVKARAEKPYEATVIDKKTGTVYRRKNGENAAAITEYVTIVRTSAGKIKKITEREGSQILAWEYLQRGDRFRYHPRFHFPYERYDKANAPYIACVSCGTKNAVSADRCSRCNLPLLK